MIAYDSSQQDLATKAENAVRDLLMAHLANTMGFGERIFTWENTLDVDMLDLPVVTISANKEGCISLPDGDLFTVGVEVTLRGGTSAHARMIENALGKAYDLPAKLNNAVFGVEDAMFDVAASKEFDESGIATRTFPFTLHCAHLEPA
ncbi:MAG TPA: hypothetical protein VFI76_01940 [Terrimicrobiaceae bacterium]|nr:hypothetical protein [Terrimicrobiaceae bacterium]